MKARLPATAYFVAPKVSFATSCRVLADVPSENQGEHVGAQSDINAPDPNGTTGAVLSAPTVRLISSSCSIGPALAGAPANALASATVRARLRIEFTVASAAGTTELA